MPGLTLSPLSFHFSSVAGFRAIYSRIRKYPLDTVSLFISTSGILIRLHMFGQANAERNFVRIIFSLLDWGLGNRLSFTFWQFSWPACGWKI